LNSVPDVDADPTQTRGATVNKAKRVALYARVSTDGQTTDNQRRELRAVAERNGWTIAVEYIDHGVSGAKGRKDRPEFDALLRAVARKEFDAVAAWSVDRLGRSLQDLVGFLSDLQSKKVDLYLHQQALDTSTPSGKAMFGMLGVFAEFERSIIQDRVKAGLARARAKGTRLGRPKASAVVEERIRELAAQGIGKVKIARILGVGVSLTQRVLA
jgi:DNA invertase Pin-like site-specific DNA recombinase